MNAKILYTDENPKNSTWADRRWAEAAMVLMRSGHSAKFTGKSVCTRLKSNQALSRWWWAARERGWSTKRDSNLKHRIQTW